jgi:hypothetical protein
MLALLPFRLFRSLLSCRLASGFLFRGAGCRGRGVQFGFDLFHGGQGGLQGLGKCPRQFVAGNADGLVYPCEAVLGLQRVVRLAQDQTDGRGIGRMLELVVDNVAIEIQLARVLSGGSVRRS